MSIVDDIFVYGDVMGDFLVFVEGSSVVGIVCDLFVYFVFG